VRTADTLVESRLPGGGDGAASERDPELIERDLLEGYVAG
jgi:N-methylhydantoinase B/oxoprolinase/acetone carboxylase alpha subunit